MIFPTPAPNSLILLVLALAVHQGVVGIQIVMEESSCTVGDPANVDYATAYGRALGCQRGSGDDTESHEYLCNMAGTVVTLNFYSASPDCSTAVTRTYDYVTNTVCN
jgi:hypothetical protein